MQMSSITMKIFELNKKMQNLERVRWNRKG